MFPVHRRNLADAPPRQFLTAALALGLPGLGAVSVGSLWLFGVSLDTQPPNHFWSLILIVGGGCWLFLGVRGVAHWLRVRSEMPHPG
jgi:hypothetical protein